MADYTKPLPLADPDTLPYWEGARAHELRAQQCAGCGKLRWPPQGFCPHCWSWESSWTKLAETGTVVSCVVVHQATNPVFAHDVPYAIAQAVIDGTDGAVVLTANVVGCPWEEVKVGMKVGVTYDDVTPEVTLPKFRPA
ncbi:MAG TPA: zinc ribbon domain-containing protein [Chloroflexota bacterium]|nr:zinc ribbon domain-containing protein [Chloroflexota bacterium]